MAQSKGKQRTSEKAVPLMSGDQHGSRHFGCQIRMFSLSTRIWLPVQQVDPLVEDVERAFTVCVFPRFRDVLNHGQAGKEI